jgi:hypothetical protein
MTNEARMPVTTVVRAIYKEGKANY